MEEVFRTILITLITGLIVWIARGLYSKHFEIRPRIFFRLEENGGAYRPGTSYQLDITWNNRFIVSNNSSYTAYKIKFHIPDFNEIVHNSQQFKHDFHSNFLLEPNSEKEFKLITTKKEKSTEVIKKYSDILKDNKPRGLENFKMLIEYENEKGKKFYTEFTDNKNHFSNRKKIKYKEYYA